MLTGAEVFLKHPSYIKKLKANRLAYLGHSASVDKKGQLILSQLLKHKDIKLSCLFSPQHGFYPTKQANMIISKNTVYKGIKIYSLYSQKTRRLTTKMKNSFDVLLFDLQDVGCRIYTYLSTLFYLIEDLANQNKSLIVLDRPNPLGRYVEGNLLKERFKSFVGVAPLPMAHGLTLGELALWYKHTKKLKTNLQVIRMRDYKAQGDRPWPLPSPNMSSLTCAKCYPGTVLLEGTTISEGRGTVKPFEIFGYPKMNTEKIKKYLKDFSTGCLLREIQFEPTFDKWQGKVCTGFRIHLEKPWANKGVFRPYRLICLFLKAFYQTHRSCSWKTPPPYEYEYKLDPIDIISGSDDLQKWIKQKQSAQKKWDDFLTSEEQKWKQQQKDFFIYK